MLLKHGDKLYYFTSSKQNLLFSSSWSRRRKGSSTWSRRSPNFWSSQCASIASVRLLTSQWSQLSPLYQAHGLYPSNMHHNILRMLKKDLTRFRQTPGRVTISQSSYQRHSRWHHLLISAGSAFVLEAKYSFLFLLIHNWIPETMFVSNEYHYLSLLLLLKYFEKWKCLKPRFFLPRGL